MEVSSAKKWSCECGLLWFKCEKHVHAQRETVHRHAKRKPAPGIYGVDKPLPKLRRIETVVELVCEPGRRLLLKPGSKLAARFPHLVQAASPT